MKISDDKPTQDLLNYLKQVPETQKATSSEINDNKNGGLSEEKVELSKRASDLNKIRDIVQKTPDIREEKVALPTTF